MLNISQKASDLAAFPGESSSLFELTADTLLDMMFPCVSNVRCNQIWLAGKTPIKNIIALNWE